MFDTHHEEGALYDYLVKHRLERKNLNRERNDRERIISIFSRCAVQGVDPLANRSDYLLCFREKKYHLFHTMKEAFHKVASTRPRGNNLIYCGEFQFQAWSRNFQRLRERGKEQCVQVNTDAFLRG